MLAFSKPMVGNCRGRGRHRSSTNTSSFSAAGQQQTTRQPHPHAFAGIPNPASSHTRIPLRYPIRKRPGFHTRDPPTHPPTHPPAWQSPRPRGAARPARAAPSSPAPPGSPSAWCPCLPSSPRPQSAPRGQQTQPPAGRERMEQGRGAMHQSASWNKGTQTDESRQAGACARGVPPTLAFILPLLPFRRTLEHCGQLLTAHPPAQSLPPQSRGW
jgi:hypothetical protein